MVRLSEPADNGTYLVNLISPARILGKTERPVSSVSIDSRDIQNDTLFIPLIGERADGHDYMAQAYEKGARAFFVGAHRHKDADELFASMGDALFICVEDTLSALQEMAGNHVASFGGITRIGITGSSGKTTTKECVAAILSQKGKVVSNAGNLNSEIGLPLSVMALDEACEYAVFEMGMNRVGEMDILADILRPEYAVITNVGTAHIGLLGSRDSIAAEKRKALKYIQNGGNAVLWDADDYLGFLSAPYAGSCSLFGVESMKDRADVRSEGLEGSVLTYRDVEIHLPLPGKYNAYNALSAIRLAELLDVSPGMIKEGLESVKPLFGRGQVWKGRVVILSDCYNANLESMRSSIDFFSSLDEKGVKHYVLGSMKELGGETRKAHEELGSFLASAVSSDPIYLFGDEMKDAYKALRKSHNVFWTEHYEDLKNRLIKSISVGDYILLKGSRSMELERLIDEVEHAFAGSGIC